MVTAETRCWSQTASGYQNGDAPLVQAPPQSPLDTLRELKAGDVMRVEVPFVPAQFSLANALLTFDRANLGFACRCWTNRIVISA